MAQRRMFSKTITSSARFLKMPQEAQNLYFHLCMNADDDGIVEAFTIMQMLGSSEDNIRILNAKNLVKPLNEDMVAYIMDWNEHNLIRADRKVNSIYKDLLLQIMPDINVKEPKIRADTGVLPRQPTGRPVDGIGKDRLGEVSVGKVKDITPNGVSELVKYFFELKGWANKEKDFYKQNKIIYARYVKPAKQLLELCDENLDEAKHCIQKVSEWAISRKLDWAIETVFKKWYDIDILKPKDKKPYIDGMRAFKKVEGGRWYVVNKQGDIQEYGDRPDKIDYK